MKHVTRVPPQALPILPPSNREPGEWVVQAQEVPPQTGGVVVAFVRRAEAAARLSIRDRMDVTSWIEPALRCGFDRLVVHERTQGDPPNVDSFLSLYQRGESWARWGLARCGASVLVWCARTGTDFGRFATVDEALGVLLQSGPAQAPRSADVVQAFAG